MMEQWRPIPGFSNYSVSDHGRVRRETDGPGKIRAGHILANKFSGRYWSVRIGRDGGGLCTKTIQQLVLLAFVGPPPTPAHEGAHGDGNTSNNRLNNLRWATKRENCEDRDRHGRTARGERHTKATIDEAAVRSIRAMRATGMFMKDIAKRHGCTYHIVSDIVHSRSWKHVV